ncbi:phage tail protein [Arsenophonus nasoniae]|uniref:Phage tail protein n=1 Tax=Arsenophonus nasoniae TaxID=638 RepID=A0AA95K551_9GAMM|nr:phage tail protein [Arsenophonus nasoniae]WGL96660.1 phage tail protein [Arsenophonus nasoniae]
MKKLAELRYYLSEKIAYFKENPDNLYLFVENGHIVATMAASLSYEYQYTVNLIAERFSGDQNILMAVIIDWLKNHQPELLANPDKRHDGFKFEAVIHNNQTADISIELTLTERVLVTEKAGNYLVTAIPEPADPFSNWSSQ